MSTKAKAKAKDAATKAVDEADQKPSEAQIAASDTKTPAPTIPAQGEDAAEGEVAAKAPVAPDLTSTLTSGATESVVGAAVKDKAPATIGAIKPAGFIVVIGPKRGRWRAGRHFTQEAKAIPIEELTLEEAELLRNDPALAISVVNAGDLEE